MSAEAAIFTLEADAVDPSSLGPATAMASGREER